MITSNQIPEAVWRVAMMTYHREIRRHPEQAWQLAIAAAMTTWEKVEIDTTKAQFIRTIILPLTEGDGQ